MPSYKTTKEFLNAIEQTLKETDKAESENLLNSFTITKFDNISGIKEYILIIVQLAKRLKELNIPVTHDFMVHQILNSLHIEFEQLTISYNA